MFERSLPLRLTVTSLAFAAWVACGVPTPRSAEGGRQSHREPTNAGATDGSPRGAELFAEHCALCHGASGRGDGFAAPLLWPAPRDFALGMFALVSTDNGVPTDDDLVATLRRGMPGSAMPPFAWMPDTDLRALAEHVRSLAEDGMTESLLAYAGERAEALDATAARSIAVARLTPGTVLELPPDRESDQPRVDGRALYLEYCAACHGANGTGRQAFPGVTATHDMWSVRDFTQGILKGGASRRELHHRIAAGMPVSGMPATRLEPAEATELLDYVEGLIPAGAERRLVQERKSIRAAYSRVPAPARPDDPRWLDAPSTELVLAPMSWRAASILHAEVRALHDGEAIAIRVSWPDATRDDRVLGRSENSDGVALQFSAAATPPLFGMGSARHAVNLWHWKAFRARDVAGFLDLLENAPHGGADVSFYQPAPGVQAPASGADSLAARGAESLPDERSRLRVDATPFWHDGRWNVVFRRRLASHEPSEIELARGARVQLAFALWNGDLPAGPRFKSITIWHELHVE